MLRRTFTSPLTAVRGVRKYTDYQHLSYPVLNEVAYGIPLGFLVSWLIFFRMGTVFTKRSDYKNDYARVWKRKLGTGYAWADAWGPKKETFFRNLPSGTK